MCSDLRVLAQQQNNTLYKEILGDKHYYWKLKHAKQFFSVVMLFYPSCLAPSAVTLRLCPSVLPSPAVHPLLFTLCCFRCLLVFVFAYQSRSSCRLVYIFTLPHMSRIHTRACYLTCDLYCRWNLVIIHLLLLTSFTCDKHLVSFPYLIKHFQVVW